MKQVEKQVTATKTINVLTFQDFVDFLKEKNVLKKFISNMMLYAAVDYDYRRPLQDYWEKQGAYRFPSSDLWMSAFVWNEKSGGFDFWHNLSLEFNKWVRDSEIEEVETFAD